MTGIALQAQYPLNVALDDARSVVDSALCRETDLARARHAYFARICQAFEQQYRLSSDEFMQQFESGALGDDAVYFDWYATKRGLDVMRRKSHGTDGDS